MEGESEMFGFGQSETVVRVMGERMDRRRVLRVAASVGAAAVAGGVLKAMPAGAAAGAWLKTTARLNLRAAPSTGAKVLLVLAKGVAVKTLEVEKNGFIKVNYQGTVGWAYGEYLKSTNPDVTPNYIGMGVTTANVNLRQGPSTNDEILKVVPKGTAVKVYDPAFNGFRYVKVDGVVGWIYEAYLSY
jgi:uncharacterized protein YraI